MDSHHDGEIAEILIYKSALDFGNRILVEFYLSQKWGIQLGDEPEDDFPW